MGESVQMGSAVKNTLRSICCDNGWSYGVFWRLDHSNSMLLTLEDAYFEEQMGTMLGNMFLQVHMIGEGFIGQSASTGKHLWLFGDSFENQDVLQGDSEICCQFSSGMKTIAILSVEPGVVLFGSTNKIQESKEFLDQTKKLFREVNNVDALNYQLEYLPSSLTDEISDLDGLFASWISYGNGDICDELGKGCSSINPTQSASFMSDLEQAMMDLPCSNNNSQSFAMEAQVLSSNEPSTQFQHFLQSSYPLSNSSTDLSQCYIVDNLSGLLAPSPEYSITEMEMAMNESLSQSNGASLLSSCLAESEGLVNCNELFDGLGWEDIIASVECSDQSSVSAGISESISGPRKGLFSELGLAELLNGIGSTSSADEFSPNKRRVKCSSMESNQVQLASVSHNLDKISSIAKPQKHEEATKGAKKRARPGESMPPRPKDRQLIQDRLTELRKIIPNGHKPSIDVLLDRTIKYMHFLQSVTKYGDKLKQADEPKMTDRGNGVVLKDNNNGGVTWAYEVGDQTLVYPIVVEDLNPPGQMIIEMLCEDHGFFLEIADVIRGFGLNILKGVMELRQNKIWTRFIVEANKHVTRMDVFWSLIQLLQQTATSEIDSINVPANVVDSRIHVLENGQRPPLSFPISLAETRQ